MKAENEELLLEKQQIAKEEEQLQLKRKQQRQIRGDQFIQFQISLDESFHKQYLFKMNEDIIIIGNIKLIKFTDLIGIHKHILKEKTFRITLHSYPKRKKFLRPQKRYFQEFSFVVMMTEQDYERLQIKILSKIFNRRITKQSDIKKLLIFFNPNAGGNPRNDLNRAMRFIEKSNLKVKVIETQRPNHCKQYLNDADISLYEAVVIVSGDGLMHEFVNSNAVNHIAVTHVPAGSGNAFAKTQTSLAHENCHAEEAIFLVIKGTKTPFNLMAINLEHIQQPIYSFLALQWAFLADIDMNSQFLRCLGGLRFQIYSALKVLSLQRYSAKITLSTTSNSIPPLNEQIRNPQFIEINDIFLWTLFCFIPYISDKYHFAPLLQMQQEVIDMQTVSQEAGRYQLIKYLLKSQSGGHFDLDKKIKSESIAFDHRKVKSFRLEPNGQNRGIFGIDGERYESQRIQVAVSDKKVITFI